MSEGLGKPNGYSARPMLSAKECECEPEHTIARLCHCRTCPHYRGNQETQIDHALGICVNRDVHRDGSRHDFDWATYEDEFGCTGVCRCGLFEMDFDMARMP